MYKITSHLTPPTGMSSWSMHHYLELHDNRTGNQLILATGGNDHWIRIQPPRTTEVASARFRHYNGGGYSRQTYSTLGTFRDELLSQGQALFEEDEPFHTRPIAVGRKSDSRSELVLAVTKARGIEINIISTELSSPLNGSFSLDKSGPSILRQLFVNLAKSLVQDNKDDPDGIIAHTSSASIIAAFDFG